jgi:hypothetical protein
MWRVEVVSLADRVRAALGRLTADQIEERRMFGGVGFMWHGRLLVATHRGDELVLPLGKEADPGEGLRPMVMGTRVSAGWYFVDAALVASDSGLEVQLRRALDYIGGLPRRG